MTLKQVIVAASCVLMVAACGPKKLTIEETCTEFDQVDREMLDIIGEIKSKYKKDQEFLLRFNDVQVYWIQYRDRRLRAMYPKKWDLYYRKTYGKEVFNPCKCEELTRLTKVRIAELNMYLDGNSADQQDCPTVMKELGN